jgi:pyruvate/2-oxoacid:ferredoxin oxidoreductase beta subunit/Pyruvate/2-oxoacid:ferredoxin oxidoreductase gamma subunit
MSEFLVRPLPYCDGCGHRLVANKTIQVLEEMQVSPRDVVLVSDIGCHGIIDKSLATHTVHGLHGRSVALGAGLGMSLPPDKKVIVFIGDGGATIGLQHLLEAARRNVDMTVVVHNNMLYGMTGGQPSGLTLPGYCTALTPDGITLPNFDLCQLVYDAGAAYVQRAITGGDLLKALRKAFQMDGFCLVEVLGSCVERGKKFNKHLKLKDLAEQTGLTFGEWRGEARPAFCLSGEQKPSLFDKVKDVEVAFASPLEGRQAIVLCGSAGEGVQKAAELFAQAALACGLHVTKKGSYPVTVGVGFSTAEIILSRNPIEYHGISQPDVLIVVSQDGSNHNLERIRAMEKGTVLFDEEVWLQANLKLDAPDVDVVIRNFRKKAGPKNAAIYAILTFINETNILPVESLLNTVTQDSIRKYIPSRLLQEFTQSV